MDKAGWWVDEDSEFNAVADCGEIIADSHPYLLVVMTDQPYCDNAVFRFQELSRALAAARSCIL